MLVVFTSPASYEITMFGDIAKHLIQMMGHSGTIPGAITGDDIPRALENLRNAVNGTDGEPVDDVDEDEEEQVSMSQRAFPLIEMLEAAAQDKTSIRWYVK